VRLAISKRSFRVSKKAKTPPARFTIRMSESATVKITIDRLLGKRGKKKARKVGVLNTSVAGGANRLRFTGKVGRKFLTRGTYRARAAAVDTAGNVGRSKYVTFRVK
jgi:hypothetical protein